MTPGKVVIEIDKDYGNICLEISVYELHTILSFFMTAALVIIMINNT